MSAENPTGEGNIEQGNSTPGEELFAKLKQSSPQEYRNLIDTEEDRINKSLGSVNVVDNFRAWIRRPEDGTPEEWEADKRIIADRLKDTPLVDLGSGYDADGYLIAQHFGSSVYVGVDIYPHGAKEKALDPLAFDKERREDFQRPGSPECMLVRSDMLDFVSRLPDNSVNFMMNGLDCVRGGEYQEKLAKEIIRALKPGGLLVGVNIPGAPDEAVWKARNSLEEYELIAHELSSTPMFFVAIEKIKKT